MHFSNTLYTEVIKTIHFRAGSEFSYSVDRLCDFYYRDLLREICYQDECGFMCRGRIVLFWNLYADSCYCGQSMNFEFTLPQSRHFLAFRNVVRLLIEMSVGDNLLNIYFICLKSSFLNCLTLIADFLVIFNRFLGSSRKSVEFGKTCTFSVFNIHVTPYQDTRALYITNILFPYHADNCSDKYPSHAKSRAVTM